MKKRPRALVRCTAGDAVAEERELRARGAGGPYLVDLRDVAKSGRDQDALAGRMPGEKACLAELAIRRHAVGDRHRNRRNAVDFHPVGRGNTGSCASADAGRRSDNDDAAGRSAWVQLEESPAELSA